MPNNTTPLTPAELAEIREREQAATAGPWQTRFIFRVVNTMRRFANRFSLMMQGNTGSDWSDAEFTAHAREDVPRLLATIEAQAGEIAELRELIQYMWPEYCTGCDNYYRGSCQCSNPQYGQCSYATCPDFAAIDAAGKGE